ncbi:hypothetical protein JCM30760_26120 [Thiomicrorhabdus hydrogeniphila]
MKKFITALSIASVLTLSGCGTSPMIVKEADNKIINGFDISITNLDKITDRKINLTFVKDKDGEIEDFPWDKVEEGVRNKLTEKGVILTPEGRSVTVELNKFRGLGSQYATLRIARGYVPGGVVSSLGGSVAQDVAVRAVDRKIAKDKVSGDTGDGKNFVADLAFTVKSTGYESKVGMSGVEALYGYVSNAKVFTIQAISEFFVPKK